MQPGGNYTLSHFVYHADPCLPVPLEKSTALKLRRKLVVGPYVAEFYRDTIEPPVYHYVVTRTGSPEILSLGQVTSLQQADDEARRELQRLVGEDGMSQTA